MGICANPPITRQSGSVHSCGKGIDTAVEIPCWRAKIICNLTFPACLYEVVITRESSGTQLGQQARVSPGLSLPGTCYGGESEPGPLSVQLNMQKIVIAQLRDRRRRGVDKGRSSQRLARASGNPWLALAIYRLEGGRGREKQAAACQDEARSAVAVNVSLLDIERSPRVIRMHSNHTHYQAN